MRNKGGVIFLTIIVTVLCLYYLSFTFVSRSVQNDAIAQATDETGTIDFSKKQAYLDSIWTQPVYNFLGFKFTYQEVKETELNLGLDLQGGMHVTLEVSPVDIIKGLSGNSEDKNFNEALKVAASKQATSQSSFVDLFYESYQELAPGSKLSSIFAIAANRGRISFESTDAEVMEVLKKEVDDAIDRSFQILRTRIDRFGTSQPNIQRLQGTGRIQVEIPGADNPERVRKLLQGVAKLEFWEVWNIDEIYGTVSAINDFLVKEQKANAANGLSEEAASTETASSDQDALAALTDDASADTTATEDSALDSLANNEVSPFIALLKAQYGLVYSVKDTAKINRILKRKEVQALIPNNIDFKWSHKPVALTDGQEVLELNAVKIGRNGQAPLTGEVITDARQAFDQRGQPSVSMSMNAEGSKKWRKLTGANTGRRIAIALDNYVYTAPNVNGEIPNGQSEIAGNFTIEEAKDLANVLKAGALPAPTKIVEEGIIGPTLGKEAQAQGIISIIGGLGLVVLFMIAYYYRGGFVANIALIFNIFFILGILAQLGASLTLPGIAGIVLTIGMAVDANVLIFERIKEELANGVDIKEAIRLGFSKAYSSIVDSNATTFLTGIILYVLGQGPIKGFAVTLMIGIACSFFTAVFITRVIIEAIVARTKDTSKITFETALSRNMLKNITGNFIQKRKAAYAFSTIFIVLGIAAIFIKGGLNFGVDFTGGRSYVVGFGKPMVASELKVSLAKTFENTGTEVKTYGANNVLKVTTSYLIDDDSDEADVKVRERLIEGLTASGFTFDAQGTEVSAEEFTISSTSKVLPTIADDIKDSAQEAILFALLGIFLYILMRFRKWQFGLGAVIALFHDVLIVVAAFGFAGLLGISFEIDQVFVAAILTVIGYSINNTVVVFDRNREFLADNPASDFISTLNRSISSTLNRTVMTSLTTLLVVTVLLVFGGEVLRSFSFALFIGILFGTYSSIFIATPVVVDFIGKGKKS
ncbi:protein translocase subunit SecDF [Cytophagales bacterium LB-30]|uniref:Multifunctional fusion protein n=1 Tax=Shiella aurantiaca TaxID=3058365 RepID=A0ABT8F255_9BACT|nr:protein translocase subunit SecDF [Shiella aurantiaca]MDN4164533.1 protein translocase subunit SecDF [Shiella aurantiaca]